MDIKRSDLKSIADNAINSTSGLTTAQKRELRKVAETAEAVLFRGWWNSSANCGCLVGTALNNNARLGGRLKNSQYKNVPRYESPLHIIGIIFDRELGNHLAFPRSRTATIVKVVD